MNKKSKKILAAVSAVAMCALTTFNINVFAVETGSPLDRIIKSYGEPYLTYEVDNYANSQEVFVAKENEKHLLRQNVDVYINMKDEETMPEITLENAEIYIADVGYHFVKYCLISEDDEAEKKAVEAISKCNEVLSVDKVYTVYGDPASIFAGGAWVKFNDDTKDILSEYEFSDSKYVLGHWNDGTPIISDEHKFIPFASNAERFAFMKKMQDNNIKYELSIGSTEEVPPIIAEETVHLYTSLDYDLYLNDNVDINSPEPILSGDANNDGKVSMADAVLIMQALSNPDEYKITPQGMANADIDGDGLTPTDAAKIQEIVLNS